MKIEIIIKETRGGDIDFKMLPNVNREPMTKLEAAYSQTITKIVKEALPGITQILGGKGIVNLGGNNPAQS